MSLFNTIVESTLNEIGTEDAYKRFYSEIPRENYDKIVGGEKNVDKFTQFFLNSVKDGFDPQEAADILNSVRTANNLVRQNILNDFKRGEFIDPYDVESELSNLSSGKTVLSKKEFASEGYVELAEDDVWKLTATLNYAANNHYYGKSHWCTASDRNGHYDGYRMFLRYAYENNSILYQFVNKEDINKTIQAALNVNHCTECCDWRDERVDFRTYVIREHIPVEMVDKAFQQVVPLLEKAEQLAKVEQEYQNGEDKFTEKRRELKRKKREIKVERLRKECAAKNEKMRRKIEKTWNYVVSNNLYQDISLLNKIWHRDNRGNIPETTEEAMETYFLGIGEMYIVGENTYLIFLGTFYGDNYEVYCDYYDYDAEPGIDTEFDSAIGGYNSNGVYAIVRAGREEMSEVIYVSDPITNGKLEIYNVQCQTLGGTEFKRDKYFTLLGAKDGKNLLYIADSQKMIPIEDYEFYGFMPMGDVDFLISCDMIDEEEGKPYNGVCFVDLHSGFTHLFKGKANLSYNCCTIKYPEKTVAYIRKDVFGNGIKTVEFDNDLGITKVSVYDFKEAGIRYLNLETEDGKENVSLAENPSEPIFGKWAEDIEAINNTYFGSCFIAFYRYKTLVRGFDRMLVRYQISTGKYFTENSANDGWVECDKNGDTEEDRITKHNFEKWQQQGGHSPEAKAQMDKMYKDRYGEVDKSSADDAWREKEANDLEAKRKEARYNAFMNDTNDPSAETLRNLGNGNARAGFKKYYDNKVRYNPRMNDYEDWDESDEVEPRFDNMSRRAGLNESAQKMASIFKRLKDL